MAVIRGVADTRPLPVAELQAAMRAIIGTATRVIPGMETVVPGTGMATGTDTAIGTDMTTTIIIVFPSGSFHIGTLDMGIPDMGITITVTPIIPTIRITIPITIIRTTATTTLAETDQPASQRWFRRPSPVAAITAVKLTVSSDPKPAAQSASFSGIMICR